MADRARFAVKTAEQREARLQQMSATAQHRLASETAGQTVARLRQLSPRHSRDWLQRLHSGYSSQVLLHG